jgi:plasmid replication initiation protein
MGIAKKAIRRCPERFPTGVQKSYFMLSDAERTVLNKALEKYQRGAENEEVCVTFSPRFEHIWLESKKLLFDSLAQTPAAIGLRSKYAIRLYAWAKDHLSVGTKRITLEELRTVLGLDPVKDTDGNVIREARLGAWANFRQRALNIAMAEINAKTDLNIALESLEQAEHQRVAALIFTIKARTVSKGKPSG